MAKKATKTEIRLAVALAVTTYNLMCLRSHYEKLAADHDEIPPPNMQDALDHVVNKNCEVVSHKNELTAVFQDVMQRFHSIHAESN